MKLALLLLLGGCAGASRMTYRHVDSEAIGRPMSYGVYTPPEFTGREKLPLFVFLHGGDDDVMCLEKEGVVRYLDKEIESGRIPRVVIVVPQGDRGFWANWAAGSNRYEDWVLREAVPAVASAYGTQGCPDGCHLFGISMGGSGTLRYVLSHPGQFRSAAILSAPILDANGMQAMMDNWLLRTFARLERVFGPGTDAERKRRADPFQLWRSPEDLTGLRLFFAHGDDDREGIAETNAAFHRHLEKHGIPHRYLVFPGGHRWQDWMPIFGAAIREGLRIEEAEAEGRPSS